VQVSKKAGSFAIVFLFTTLVFLYPAKFIISYGQTSFIPDKLSITKTTDCINSMITSVFMGSSSDCSNDNSNKINSTSKNNLSAAKDSLFDGSQNDNNNTFDSPTVDSSNVKSGPSPSLDNPSTFTESLKQNQGLSLANTSSLQSMPSKTKSDNSLDPNNDLGNLLDKKNKHGKEIFDCFNRAIVSTNYLPDSAIIKCAKDHNSFS
jgi:hypothetical protein